MAVSVLFPNFFPTHIILVNDRQFVYPVDFIANQVGLTEWVCILVWGSQPLSHGEYVMRDVSLPDGRVAYGIKYFDENCTIVMAFYIEEDNRDMARTGLVNRDELNRKIQEIYTLSVPNQEPGCCVRFQFTLQAHPENEHRYTVLFYRFKGLHFNVSTYFLSDEDVNHFIDQCDLQEVGIPPDLID